MVDGVAMNTLIWIGSGLLAGALARVVTRGRARGFVADAATGALGSVLGTWLLRLLYGVVPAGNAAHLATAFFGALTVVALGRLARELARGASQFAVVDHATNMLDLEAHIRRLSEFERSVLARVLGRRAASGEMPEFRHQLTVGERLADQVASFGGSWTFLLCFAAFMLAWMFVNTSTDQPADPYPFILLNLVLSCLAAAQAPVIMMSQNRQSSRDRFEAQQDYQVNLRAEIQIAALHAKLDDARTSDWQQVMQLQARQLEVLERIERRLSA
jgi:uncharacterized membrane protein/uncharacterized membrane protein YeaQ/YmgE (transglycosylase-associated protein family)